MGKHLGCTLIEHMADRNADVRVVINIAATTREGERTHAKLAKDSCVEWAILFYYQLY